MSTPTVIQPGITAVGVANPDLRVFDVIMHTEFGTTYNSYLVQGAQKTALIDVVKNGFEDEYFQTLDKLTDLSRLDYIVLNHTEPDHSGGLERLLQRAPNATVISSRPANMMARQIANREFASMIVVGGESVDLGGKTLRFIAAPFLHWPDSIFTHVPEDRTLFTGDVFGCHYGLDAGKFADEIDDGLLSRARKYYFDVIMGPFKGYMLEAIGKIRDLELSFVCPSHGPVCRKDVRELIGLSEQWSQDALRVNDPKQVLIGYVSCYGYTRRLAEAIAQGVEALGLTVTLLEISQCADGALGQALGSCDALLLGSPTVNRDVLPPVWQAMLRLSAYRMRGRLGGAFGAFGWSGEAAGMIEQRLTSLGMKIPVPALKCKLNPTPEDLRQATEFGRAFGQAVAADTAGQ